MERRRQHQVGSGSKKPRVGLIPAISPSLAREGAFIGVFTKDSVLTFYGNLQVRVLGGVVNVESYALKPCQEFLTLCIPQASNQPAINMAAMDASLADDEFVDYLKPFRESGCIHFHAGTQPHCPRGDGRHCVTLMIAEEDVESLNKLVQSQWADIIAVALFKPFRNPFTAFLPRYGLGLKSSQQLKEFCRASLDKSVKIPMYYKYLAWDLVAHVGASVLICGKSGSGKSTLGRYLINYMLNRYPAVAYLECDPGQCEFTCPEVLSLHILTEPVLGPAYTHQRTPAKAYYFGDTSPKADPEYYIRVLRALYEHFTSVVRHSNADIPLVINTCGWIYDMGVQLFLDVLRSLSPSHVVRLIPKRSRRLEDVLKALPQLTEDFLTTTAGLFTSADKKPAMVVDSEERKPAVVDSKDKKPTVLDSSSGWDVPVNPFPGIGDVRSMEEVEVPGPSSPGPSSPGEGEGEGERGDDRAREQGYDSNDIDMYGSSEEEFTISAGSSSEDGGEPFDKDEKVRKKRKLKRKRLHLINAKLNGEKKRALEARRMVRVGPVRHWTRVLSYLMQCVESPSTSYKNSMEQRQLGLVSYFSPLLGVAQDVAKQYELSDPLGNLLRYAPPLAVPWADVAIHVAHKQVPAEHMLYALNGKVVCLGHAQPDQMVEFSPQCSDVFKLMKLHSPLIEFIGLGLLRAIDPAKKLFYLTTPLSGSSLENVNVFVLGNPDKVDLKGKRTPLTSSLPKEEQHVVPYQIKNFKPIDLGQYSWSSSAGRTHMYR